MTATQDKSRLTLWLRNNPQIERYRTLFIFVGALFAFFLFRGFFFETGIVKTALQVDFEAYVDARERHFILGEPGSLVLPRIHITIQGSHDDVHRQLLIDPIENADKVTRVLSMTREAGVFGLNRGAAVSGEGVVLRVEDGEREFTTSFSKSDIENNVKAESLLKLLTIHGKPVA